MSSPPHLVILGAGYAGSLCARALEPAVKRGDLRVTVLERRDGMHHKIGSIRASVLGGEHIDRVRIPFAKIFQFAKLVEGEIEKLDYEKQTVNINGTELAWDMLVCATGQISQCIGDLPLSVKGKDEVRAYFKKTSAVIHESNHIVIAGGGPSAAEFAGEIRAQYPDKKITLVCSSAHMLSSCVARPPTKFFKELYSLLQAQHIELIRGEKVVSPTPADFPPGQKYLSGSDLVVKIDSGKELPCDLLLWAATWNEESFRYPDAWLNAAAEVHVNETFQVVDFPNVFGFGDCSSLAETKQAIMLPDKIPVLVHNILAVARSLSKGETAASAKTKRYKLKEKSKMFLPMGPTVGVSFVGSWTYGSAKTSKWKGKDLFSDLFWTTLTGAGAPPVVHQ